MTGNANLELLIRAGGYCERFVRHRLLVEVTKIMAVAGSGVVERATRAGSGSGRCRSLTCALLFTTGRMVPLPGWYRRDREVTR
jgi:hypothetical protein